MLDRQHRIRILEFTPYVRFRSVPSYTYRPVTYPPVINAYRRRRNVRCHNATRQYSVKLLLTFFSILRKLH